MGVDGGVGEAALIGGLISAAGAGTQMVASNKKAKEQDRLAAQGIIEQGAKNQEAGKKVNKNIQDVAAANPQAQAAARAQDYVSAIRRAQPTANVGLGAVQGANARYAEDVDAAKSTSMAQALDRAGTQAAVDAPAMLRQKEAEGRANTAQQIGMIGEDSKQLDYINRLRIANVKNNPWLMAAGSVLKGAGTGYAAGGAGGWGGGTGTGTMADNGLNVSAFMNA